MRGGACLRLVWGFYGVCVGVCSCVVVARSYEEM